MSAKVETAQLGEILQQITTSCSQAALQQAASFGISEAQARALTVFRDGEEARIGELARRMNLAPSRLTRLVDGLVMAELARRMPDPSDRRATIVTLTRAGKKARRGLTSICQERYHLILEKIPVKRQELMLDVLRELAEKLSPAPGGAEEHRS